MENPLKEVLFGLFEELWSERVSLKNLPARIKAKEDAIRKLQALDPELADYTYTGTWIARIDAANPPMVDPFPKE